MKFTVKLSFIFILVAFVPLLLGGLFLLNFFNDHLERVVRENLVTNASARAHETVRFLSQKIEQAKIMTSSIEEYIVLVENGVEEEYYVDEGIVNAYIYYNSFFENFFILDGEGNVIFSKNDDNTTTTIDWGDSVWFDIVKNRKDTVVSDVVFDKKLQNLKLAIFTSLKDNADFFVVSEVFTNNFFQIFRNEIDNSCCIFLVNYEGDVLFSSNKDFIYNKISEDFPFQENFKRKEGSFDFYLNGERNIGGFYIIEGLMWQVVLAQPEKEIFEFLQLMAINYFTLIIIFLLPIILFSFILSRKIMKPLKSISAVSKRVAMGDLDVKANINSKDEFGELAENFNKMTQEVKKVREVIEKEKKELESKVKERTKELKELNDNLENEVQKRTKDMEKKMVELEKMSKLMVGRESKMIELKNKLKEMEEYIEKLKKQNS